MFNFLFTVVLFRFPCVTGQHQSLMQGDRGLTRSSFQNGLSYANFEAHKFQHLQGSLLDSSCEVVRVKECAFACAANAPCVSFNVASSPNENGKFRCELLSEDKFRSPDKLTDSQEFHHYSIKVSDNLKYSFKVQNEIVRFTMYVRRVCYGRGAVHSRASVKANSSYAIHDIATCPISRFSNFDK